MNNIIKIKYLIRAILLTFALALSMVSVPLTAHAQTQSCLWIGAGDGMNFSDALNWSNCNNAAPSDGSSLVFDNTGIPDAPLLTNDLTDLSVNKLIFQGNNQTSNTYSLLGNPIFLSGGIESNTSDGASINFDITLISSQAFNLHTEAGSSSIFLGNIQSSNINIGVFDLTLQVFGSEGRFYVYDSFSGTGAVKFMSDIESYNAAINQDMSGFQGSFDFIQGLTTVPISNGFAALQNHIRNGATLVLWGNTSGTITTPISVEGSGAWGAGAISSMFNGSNTVTFANATLAGNTEVYVGAGATMAFTNLIHNDFTLQKIAYDTGILVGGHTGTSPVQVTIDQASNEPAKQLTVLSNQIVILNGVRSDATVTSGGTLKGTGTVNNLVVQNGATVSPGNSPGCVTVAGDLTEAGTMQVELGGTVVCSEYDQVKVSGTVTLNDGLVPLKQGLLELAFVNGFVASKGQSFMIIDNQGSSPVSGIFAGLTEGEILTSNAQRFSITYVGGTGNDVVITALGAVLAPNTGLQSFRGTYSLFGLVLITIGLVLLVVAKKIRTV